MKTLLFSLFFSFLAFSPVFSEIKIDDTAPVQRGVTILIHGWNPDDKEPAWMASMAQAIVARAGGGVIDTITVQGSSGALTTTLSTWDFDLTAGSGGEIVILVNWTDVANHLVKGVTAQEVAAVVAPLIYESQKGQPPLSELPIHLIGHSRGGGMVYELARLLGEQGIEVEQVTSLDPHPLTSADPQSPNPPFGIGSTIDSPVKVWENILFVDNYYQKLNYPTGEVVTGAYNRYLDSLPGGYHNESGYSYNILGKEYDFSDHLNVILWYHGTSDLTTPVSNGEATMTQDERDKWFNNYEAEGDTAGFFYSLIGGGDRLSTVTPERGGDRIVDGYHDDPLLGGSGSREPLSWASAVWPNVLTLGIMDGDSLLPRGTQNIPLENEYTLSLNCRSYANNAEITVFIDQDRNPYNSNNVDTAGTVTVAATGTAIKETEIAWNVKNVNTGYNYYICARIDDGTHVRYLYAPYKVHITNRENDLQLLRINKPVKDFNDVKLTVMIGNIGQAPQSNFPVSYIFRGDTVTEVCTDTLYENDRVAFTFATPLDLSEGGVYLITARTDLSTDTYPDNDELSELINSYVNPNVLSFDGENDHVIISDNQLLNFDGDFSLEAWFLADTSAAVSNRDILSKHANYWPGRKGYVLEYDGTNISAVLGIYSGWVSIDTAVSTGEWHHVAMVYNASNSYMKMYLDSALVDSVNAQGYQNSTRDLYIGASQQYGNYWHGAIDEVRIWSVARTQEEIIENMNKEIDPATPGLTAYYTFNRGIPAGDNTTINLLPDMTANNLHGALSDFALNDTVSNFIATCVLDLTAPVVICPGDQVREITDGDSYTIEGNEFDATVSDNCGLAGILNSFNQQSTLAGDTLPQDTTLITWTATDLSGHVSSCSFKVVVRITTDVPVNKKEAGITLYPNPARDIFFIRSPEKVIKRISVVNLAGQIILERSGSSTGQENRIDLTGKTNGIYLVRVVTADKTYYFKIIKQ